MTDFLDIQANPWLIPAIAIVAVLLIVAGWWVLRDRRSPFQRVIDDISFDRIENLVIPSADEGEIMLDYLLLTSKGLLILEVKDILGTVFGGDKLQEWSVIANDGRFTFNNPQAGLYDRVAAVRQIVRDVPVEGRILFLDGAEFAKGVPEWVVDLEGLVAAFGEPDKVAAKNKVEAFKSHWERIRRAGT